jgi:ATP-dependent protease ClpP protease subunit
MRAALVVVRVRSSLCVSHNYTIRTIAMNNTPLKIADWQAPKGAGWYQISGTINETVQGNLLGKMLNWADERKEETPGVFVLYLDSIGGNVGDALAIRGSMNLIRRRGHKVILIILGRCSSCAAVIATAADEVYMDTHAWFMIHAVESASDGGAAKIIAEGEYIKRLNKQTFALIATPHWLAAEIEEAVKENHTIWLSTQQAWERGLINGVLAEPSITVRVPKTEE